MSDKYINFIDSMIRTIPKVEDVKLYIHEIDGERGWYYKIKNYSPYERFEIEYGTYCTIDGEKTSTEELTLNTQAELKPFFDNEFSELEDKYYFDEDLAMAYNYSLDETHDMDAVIVTP